jgi:sortase (surface protein transpeptidase)
MNQTYCITNLLRRSWLLALLLTMLLAGCQPATNQPVVAVAATPLPPAPMEPAATRTTIPTPAPATPQTATQAAEPVSADEASAPVQLSIPAIGLDVAVSPMGWQVTEVDGTRTTVWALPEAGVGWHPDSALAGSEGNVVISGHQLLGDAAFAPLTLGDVVAGQEVLLTDSEGRTFVYQVTAVSEPLPISDASSEELALAAQYTAQSSDPELTLITGWPDFSSTHRLFVSAKFVGVAE